MFEYPSRRSPSCFLSYFAANELEDILSCDDEVLNDVYQWWEPPVRRLPPLLWVRIQTDLGPYLVERGLKGGTPVLSWYHRQFREAAEEVWGYVLSVDFGPKAS